MVVNYRNMNVGKLLWKSMEWNIRQFSHQAPFNFHLNPSKPPVKNVATARAKLRHVMEAKKKAKDNKGATKDGKAPQLLPKIQRVPEILAQGQTHKKYYEPKWVSIGPIHHGNPKLKLAEERYKLELVAKFIQDSGHESDEALYGKIEENLRELRKCFHAEVIEKHDDETLGWMLFLDGCFALQFINSYARGELKRLFKIKNAQIAFAQQDLFLLENQIPFLVLKLLMDPRKDYRELKDSIKHFIRSYVNTPQKYDNGLEVDMDDQTSQEPAHLLDLLRLVLLQQPSKVKSNDGGEQIIEIDGQEQSTSRKRTRNVIRKALTTLNPCKNEEDGGEQQSFRSVQDLKAAGIILKPSKTCSLRDIKFSSLGFAAQLELPSLLVDDSMAPKFLNLIAYEMCPDNTETEYEITSYISFLDSLIDYPNDVKELRSANILYNRLGCDDEVAQLFNEIAKDLGPNAEVYEDVIGKIEKHYKNKCMIWMAQVFNDHFSTPWTVLAFLAAVLALALTGIQTWFTVYPRG